MALNSIKPSFMTGIHYLNSQQYNGESLGGMKMINRRLQFSKNLHSKDLYAHYGCVNAIEFSNDGEWLVSGGDDKRVLLWNVDKTLSGSYQPKAMKGEHSSNIFCLGFNASHNKLFSAGNDEQVILHDVNTGESLDVFLHDEAVYGLSVDPVNENVFASACDDGRVLIWDIRQTTNDPFMLAGCSSAYHAVMYNPLEPRFIATANAKDGVCLWDIRKPRISLMRYGVTLLSQSAMSVRFNSTGTHLLALRRRLPPVIYEVSSVNPAAEFDHQEYYNSCTMKSCCFAGDRDQYVLSGSDDFKLYVWQIPDSLSSKNGVWVNKAHLILRGHRSIVNQVRYNDTYGILASSGVEKIVKLWSSFPISYSEGHEYVTSNDFFRKVYTHEEYINLVLESGQFMTHDYSHHSVQEDPRMMAFFDSLVQRDIEGWTSDSSDATDLVNTCFVVQSSESPSSTSSSSSDDDSLQPAVHNSKDDKNDSAEQKEKLLRPTSLSLSYITQRALASNPAEKSVTNDEETTDLSFDRISQLIARKRREQMLKSAKSTLSEKNCKLVRKKIRYMKKYFTKNNCSIVSGSKNNENSESNGNVVNGCNNSNSHENTKKTLSVLLKAKDKRKLLRRKRAKLSKDATLAENSSESDASEKELVQINVNKSNKNEVEEEDDANLPKLKSEEVDVPIVSNGSVHKKDSSSVEGLDAVLPNPSSNGLNGTDSSVETDSNSVIHFPSKNGRHNNRNYRKRSAEDLDDD